MRTSPKEKFIAAENAKDPAAKILQLLDLDSTISRTRDAITSKVSEAAHKRTVSTGRSRLKQAALLVASLPLVTCVITGECRWYSIKSYVEKLQEMRENLGVGSFEKTIKDYQDRGSRMLDDTITNCDLKETSQSPYFPRALHAYDPLREKFEAAAIARAALGGYEPQEAPAPETPKLPKPLSAKYPQIEL